MTCKKYRVMFTERALRQLKKMDKCTAKFILAWIKKNLEGCSNPRQHGKSLVANKKGQWRYRIGDYRLIVEISEYTVTILVINVGHRKDVYRN